MSNSCQEVEDLKMGNLSLKIEYRANGLSLKFQTGMAEYMGHGLHFDVDRFDVRLTVGEISNTT